MFIKATKSKNYTYLQLVQSYRKDKTVKHQVLFNLGRLDKIQQNGQLEKMAYKLLSLANHPLPTPSKTSKTTKKNLPILSILQKQEGIFMGILCLKSFGNNLIWNIF